MNPLHLIFTNVYDRNRAALRNKRIRRAINQGGTSCFDGTQLVVTKRGSIPISEVLPGDIVKSRNLETRSDEWRVVKDVFAYLNSKPTIRVKLKNGKTITATEDHKIYYEGGCDSIKHILSLVHERKMATNKKV